MAVDLFKGYDCTRIGSTWDTKPDNARHFKGKHHCIKLHMVQPKWITHTVGA